MKTIPFVGVVVGTLVFLTGCRGSRGVGGPALETTVPLVTAQIQETLLGIPSRSLTMKGEPALLGQATGRVRLVLAAEETPFVELLGPRLRPQQVRGVVDRVSRELNKNLRRLRLECRAASYPPTCSSVEAPQTLFGVLTPYLVETGGPQDKAAGKSEKLLMVRLTLTEAQGGQSIAVREFYSGYTLSAKPPASN